MAMCNASGHNYRNSSFIVDVAMGRYHVLHDVFLVTIKFQLFFSVSISVTILIFQFQFQFQLQM